MQCNYKATSPGSLALEEKITRLVFPATESLHWRLAIGPQLGGPPPAYLQNGALCSRGCGQLADSDFRVYGVKFYILAVGSIFLN